MTWHAATSTFYQDTGDPKGIRFPVILDFQKPNFLESNPNNTRDNMK